MKRLIFIAILSLSVQQSKSQNPLISHTSENSIPAWDVGFNVMTGTNFDVAVHRDTFVCISTCYEEFDNNNTLIFSDTEVFDQPQSIYDFSPAVDISTNGYVHLITRGNGGKNEGFQLYYHVKKIGAQDWILSYIPLSHPVSRNYVVDIVTMNDTTVFCAHMHRNTDDVWSTIHFYKVTNGVIDSLGAFENSDKIRSDSEFRMKRHNDQIHLISGKPDPNGKVFYMHAPADSALVKNLYLSSETYQSGVSRKGAPDLATDSAGYVHFVYGSPFIVHYNRRNIQTQVNNTQVIFHELNQWHQNFGMSAIAVSPDGKNLLSIGLQTNNTKTADRSELYYSISADSGQTWTYQKTMEIFTHAGEGRMRPRIVVSNHNFCLFFHNIFTGNIQMKSIPIEFPPIDTTENITFLPEELFHTDTIIITVEKSEHARVFYTTDNTLPTLTSKEFPDSIIHWIDSITLNTICCKPGCYVSYQSAHYKVNVVTKMDQNLSGSTASPVIFPVPSVSGEVFIRPNGFDKCIITSLSGSVIKILELDSAVFSCSLRSGAYVFTFIAGNKKSISLPVTLF